MPPRGRRQRVCLTASTFGLDTPNTAGVYHLGRPDYAVLIHVVHTVAIGTYRPKALPAAQPLVNVFSSCVDHPAVVRQVRGGFVERGGPAAVGDGRHDRQKGAGVGRKEDFKKPGAFL